MVSPLGNGARNLDLPLGLVDILGGGGPRKRGGGLNDMDVKDDSVLGVTVHGDV